MALLQSTLKIYLPVMCLGVKLVNGYSSILASNQRAPKQRDHCDQSSHVLIVCLFFKYSREGGVDVHMFNLCEKLCNFEKSALRISFCNYNYQQGRKDWYRGWKSNKVGRSKEVTRNYKTVQGNKKWTGKPRATAIKFNFSEIKCECVSVSPSNRRKTCACCDSSRKSTPPRDPVHYGTWRKRQTTLCMSSPSPCLGRAHWANRCASGRRRRPRLRPLRVKVKRDSATHEYASTQIHSFTQHVHT